MSELVTESNFQVSLGEFDGPFDLLLDLVRQKKMDINEVSLAEIASSYVAFVRDNEFKLKEAASFLTVAATLMLIKSRSLLPKIVFEEEDESEIDNLKLKLRILREIKAVSTDIKGRFRKQILFRKQYHPQENVKFRPSASLSLENILQAFDSLAATIKLEEAIPQERVNKQISLQEITSKIYQKIDKYLKLNFDEVAFSKDKKEKAASFLAVLELFRNGKIDLFQEEAFGRIQIEKKYVDGR